MYKSTTKGNRGAAILMCIFLAGIIAGCGSQAEENRLAEEPATAMAGEGAKQEKEEETSSAEVLNPEALAQGDSFGYGAASYASVQDFSYRLLEQNLEQANPVLSPVSAYLAMGMAGAGAQGETLEEFEDVLGADFSGLSGELMDSLHQDTGDMQALIADSAWLDETLVPREDWIEKVKSCYKAEIFNSQMNGGKAQAEINDWVRENTKGMIQDILREPLPDTVRLALFNAVYFKGDWLTPFDAYLTGEQEFTVLGGEVILTDMLQSYQERRQYISNGIAEGVVLPYQGEKYSFAALKPVENITIREMYGQLSMEDVCELLHNSQNVPVNLRLPKFEITFDRELNECMINMGLIQAFDRARADFSGIGTTGEGSSLHIGMVRQKAVVRVDEKGTEAAAATGVMLTDNFLAMPPEEPPIDLFFDEPFLYMIVDNETDVPLFMGILDNPVDLQGDNL